jgi:hypothetical protein
MTKLEQAEQEFPRRQTEFTESLEKDRVMYSSAKEIKRIVTEVAEQRVGAGRDLHND